MQPLHLQELRLLNRQGPLPGRPGGGHCGSLGYLRHTSALPCENKRVIAARDEVYYDKVIRSAALELEADLARPEVERNPAERR